MLQHLWLFLGRSLPYSAPQFIAVSKKYRFSTMATSRSNLVAVAQLTVTEDKYKNMETVKKFTREASEKGAKMIFFPEACDYIAASKPEIAAMAESLTGETMKAYSQIAKESSIWMSMGGIHIKDGDSKKILNTHVLFDNNGRMVDSYAKSHLFDVLIPEKKVDLRESTYVTGGSRLPPPIDTPCGILALAICYDLRFPELSAIQKLGGAQILTFPSAFTVPTGEAHWHVLLRARAIENQCYVIAAAQTGKHNEKRESYGHSLIVGPWGDILAEIKDEVGVAYAEIDLDVLSKIRQNMPVSTHRRTDLYSLTTAKPTQDLGLAEVCAYPSEYCLYPFGSVQVPGNAIFLKTLKSQAFVNKKPIVPYHVLVTPERPVPLLKGLKCNELCDFAQTALHTYRILKSLKPDSTLQLGLQDGPFSGQTIKHTHLHLLPIEGSSAQLKAGHECDPSRKWRTIDEMTKECLELRTNDACLRYYAKDQFLERPRIMQLCTPNENMEFKNKIGWKPFASTAFTVAFAAPQPILDGHTLVKLQSDAKAAFDSLSAVQICDLFQIIQYLESKLQEIFKTESTTVYASIPSGIDAKDVIFHVLPRQKDDFTTSDDIYGVLDDYNKSFDTTHPDKQPAWTQQLSV